MTIIDPNIPGIRILAETEVPADGVIFQNLWDSAIIGMNWIFRFKDGTIASSGSDDLGQFRISPGEVAVAVPEQLIVIDRLQEAERRLWSETEKLPTAYVEFLLRARQRTREQSEEIQTSASEELNVRTAEKLRDSYQRLGVPPESIPSVDELTNQLADAEQQAKQSQRVKRIPDEVKLSWVRFEDGLFIAA